MSISDGTDKPLSVSIETKLEVEAFVIGALKPEVLGMPTRPPALPRFYLETGAWEAALEFVAQLNCMLPFGAVMERVSWKAEIPEVIRGNIDQGFEREKRLFALFDDELEESINCLHQARLPFVLFKGADIGRRFYPDRILRPITSISFFVSEDAFHTALKALAKGGYRRKQERPDDPARVLLSREGRGSCPVEICSKLYPNDTPESVAAVLSESSEENIPGSLRGVAALATEQSLAYLIYAGVHQCMMESPVMLNDLHYLIEGTEFGFERERPLDWDSVVQLLRDKKLLSSAWFALSLLGQEWGTQIPEDVMRDLGSGLSALRKSVLSRYACTEYLFTLDGQLLPWFLRSRFFLRDGTLEGLRVSLLGG